MRSYADLHLKQLHEAVIRGKEDYKKKAKKKTKATKATANKKTKVKIGSTQNAFEKAKKTQ